jgi:Matrixin
MKRARALLNGVACSVFALGVASHASAYCRARTCDATDPKQHCQVNGNCVTSGHLLHWPSGCLTFDVQEDGSPKLGIDANMVLDAMTSAFRTWEGADCGGKLPALAPVSLGPVACDESRYNEEGKNANIVMFRDDQWPYPNSIDAYALTTVRFDPATGELFDADIEVNSYDFDITADGSPHGVDLQSILTHEVGHFLGLAHAAPTDLVSTMRAGWNGIGLDLRTLSPDDEAGVCDVYPPGTPVPSSCEPRHGFASECNVPIATETAGCAVEPARRHGDWAFSGILFALFVARRRVRRA